MAENVQQSIEVPVGLSVFGSLISEMAAPDLPEGVSPDNQDVVYLPGSVASRPGMHKLYNQLPNNATVTYQKTFVANDGTIYNLILDSNGILWEENVTANPGNLLMLFTVPRGLYASSCTAFDREYITFHDGVNGKFIPLQFDGSHLDRVTQGGPATAPTVAEENLSFAVTTSTQNANINILAAPNGLSEVGNIVTITLTGGNTIGLAVGDTITIAGATNGGYNGTFQIIALTNTTIQVVNSTSGLAASGGGTVATGLVAVVLTAPAWGFAGMNGANYVTLAGNTLPAMNATFPIRILTIGGPGGTITVQTNNPAIGNGGSGTIAAAGNITVGTHNCVVMFLTRQGFVTAPSPPVAWNASGGKRVVVSNIPIGPVNVIARILAFTGANGAHFFYILNSITIPIAIDSTTVQDNTSTTAIIDFSDTALFNSQGIDIPGNNLFNQLVLGPSVGVFNFASRMAYWGMRNKINNLLNMGFEGGQVAVASLSPPLGWTVDTAGGLLSNSLTGLAWSIIGDGSGNAKGRITQPAYVDLNGVSIIRPRTSYLFEFYLGPIVGGASGSVICDLFSPSQGVIASASALVSALAPQAFNDVPFNLITPAVIPQDLLIRVYTVNCANAFSVAIDEMSICITEPDPFPNQFFISYVNNPEAIDGITGLLGPTEDPTPLKASFVHRDSWHFLTARGLHSTQDSASLEPAQWTIREISNHCGAASVRAADVGENFAIWCTSPVGEPPVGNGLYVYTGGLAYKVSQEVQPLFDAINPLARQSIWVKNDPINRRIYVGIPSGTATAPNQILVLDYREMDTATDLATRPPVHISFTGRMICSDLSRKWTRWNVSANCGEMLMNSGINSRFCVGSGNGQTPGQANGIGNVYWFDVLKLTDDDFGQISPYYITYFFINHEAEQALQVGLHRKLFKRYNAYIAGVGQLQITAYGNTLTNPFPSPVLLPLNNPQFSDIGDGLNVSAERVAFKIASIPNIGQTDNSFNLQKFIVTLMQDPIAPLRFGAI